MDKSQYIVFTKKHKNTSLFIKMGQQQIKDKNTIKILGITIHSK